MATITVPTMPIQSVVYQLVRSGDKTTRLLDGSKRYYRGNDAEWRAQFTLAPMTLSEGRAWRAALVQLSRRGNTFKLPIKEQKGTSTGYVGNDPLVNGAGQFGTRLECDGVTPNATIALAGDPFEVNGEFKVLTKDAIADSSGNVALTFRPQLRQSPANNAVVEIQSPKITVAIDQEQAQWAVGLKRIFNIQLSVYEDF